MKKVILQIVAVATILFSFGGTVCLNAQVTIGEGVSPQKFSVLELVSNQTMGFRLPQFTTDERVALQATPEFVAEETGKAMGLQIFNITIRCVETWNGTEWIQRCPPQGPYVDPALACAQGGGVLINDVCWATCNVDAPGTFVSTPGNYGMFYQWNRNVGWSSVDPMVNSNGVSTWDSSADLGNAVWETAKDPCPSGWRIPTLVEIQSLRTTPSNWTATPVNGRLFTDGNVSVFFPASGYRARVDGALTDKGVRGYYWSSTSTGYDEAFEMAVYSGASDIGVDPRSFGSSVRCVLE